MKLKCIIIDDIAIARRGLAEYVQKTPTLDLIGSFYNVYEALDTLNNIKVDLIFLDINLPLLSGIDFINQYSPKQLIIFTTAYSDFALIGYELNVVDYLLKPISFERFNNAVDKALKNYNINIGKIQEYIYLKTTTKIEKLLINDILYIESLSNYVKIYLDNTHIVYYTTMSSIQNQLEKFEFVRVHRGYIVNLNKINSYQKNEIKIGGTAIPIGLSYKSNFLNYINNKFKNKL